MRIVFKSLLIIASIVLAFMCYRSIMDPIEFEEEKAIRDKAVISRLIDIRKAQTAYKDAKGVYTNNFDTLIHFVKYDSLSMVAKKGELTDDQLEKGLTEEIALSLTEENAATYGIEDLASFKENFRRDTSFISVKASVFGLDYNIDSLAYVPGIENTTFELETSTYTSNSGIAVSVFEARTPFKVYLKGLNKQQIINLTKEAISYEKYEGLKVGNLLAPKDNGNWE